MGLLDGVKDVLGDLAAATERTIAEIGGQNIPWPSRNSTPAASKAFSTASVRMATAPKSIPG